MGSGSALGFASLARNDEGLGCRSVTSPDGSKQGEDGDYAAVIPAERSESRNLLAATSSSPARSSS